jgi:hypothetical protein
MAEATINAEVRLLGTPIWGLNKRDEPTMLDPRYTPSMQNMVVMQSRVRKFLGYTEVGSNLPLTGIGMELIRYIDDRGNVHHIALTTTNAYLYDIDDEEWDDITPVAGDFSGDQDDRWAYCLVTDAVKFSNNGGTALLISNGKEKPYYFEGQAGDKFQVFNNEPASFAYTYELIEFWNQLFYINPNDGADHAKGLMVADLADTSKWNGSDLSFDSTLTDVQGVLLRGVKLFYDLILYATESISVCKRVGGASLFEVPTFIYELGLHSKRSVFPFAEFHAFIGSDEKFHKYVGTNQAPLICDEIAEAFFRDLDVSKKDKIVLGHDITHHKLYFFFPTSEDTYAQHYYAWNYQYNPQTMEYGVLPKSVRGMSKLTLGVSWKCSSARFVGLKCSEVSIACNDSYTQEGKAQTIFLTDDGYVYSLDESRGLFGSSNIECWVDTPDLTWIQGSEYYLGRFLGYSFEAKSILPGATVEVQYSTDGGRTWTDFNNSPVSLTTSWAMYHIPCDVLARKCRFRNYQNSSKDLQIRNRAYKIVEGTER